MLPLGTYSFRVEGDWPLAGSITLPMCAITRSQLAALLVTHEHPVRFPFVMDAHLTADIHDHPLDRAGERRGLLARIVPRDWLAPVPPNVQPLSSHPALSRLRP